METEFLENCNIFLYPEEQNPGRKLITYSLGNFGKFYIFKQNSIEGAWGPNSIRTIYSRKNLVLSRNW